MKKIIIATAVALTLGSSTAMAAQQSDVQFFGNVSAITCDISPEINGSVSNVVQLGTVAPNTESTAPANFALKAVTPVSQACKDLTDAQTATIAWYGPLDGEGLTNQGGAATGAVALLATKNGKTQLVQDVTSSNSSVTFEANKVLTGFEFTATLKGGATPGDFRSAAAFGITYN
ncbi:fimbrial protein [Edwardsiella tarda]|uniref:fimbrial protein n=1 Tax=Edwardsiella tarda TaxID=636 RepID=UPI000D507365|nr:fimbrial protein [Edwardsiella tarda]UCQ26595.1 fimbrial protein [Edwardsiella tarda]